MTVSPADQPEPNTAEAGAGAPHSITRRSVTRAVAWGAPTVVLAVATPAAAASPASETVFTVTTDAGVTSGGTILLTGTLNQVVVFSIARTDETPVGFVTPSMTHNVTEGQFDTNLPIVPAPVAIVMFSRTDMHQYAAGTATLTVSQFIPTDLSEPHVFSVEWDAVPL